MNENEHELPFLAGIAGILRWIEELANILSGPLLTAGLAIALIDLLTDGALLTTQPALLYAWAISQAVGVDAQLVAAWDKARQALRTRHYWSLLGLLILGWRWPTWAIWSPSSSRCSKAPASPPRRRWLGSAWTPQRGW